MKLAGCGCLYISPITTLLTRMATSCHLCLRLCLVIQTAWPQQIKPWSCYGSSCWGYAANHLSLRVKCDRLTHIFQLFRHLKRNLPSTAGGSSLSDIQLLDFRIPDFWGAGYRGNLLFYRTSCRRASNPWVGKMMSGAYHLSHNNFEITGKCIHTNEPRSWHDGS